MGKRIRVKSKDRSGILSLFNSKGYPKKKRGQPKLNPDIKVGILARIKQYKNLSPYKAWLEITKLENFPYILKLHFKNRKGNADWWIKRFQQPEEETGIRENFYRNHLRVQTSKTGKK